MQPKHAVTLDFFWVPCRVDRQIVNNISEEFADSNFRPDIALKANHHKDTRQTAPPKRRYLFTNLHGVILYQHGWDKHKARNIKQLLRRAAAFICLKGQRFGLKKSVRCSLLLIEQKKPSLLSNES
jgi:hypothetical protein